MASRALVASSSRVNGLRKERQRVAEADVAEAKKRKEEADKSLQTGREDLKKAKAELAKQEQTQAKSKQDVKEREQQVQQRGSTIEEQRKRIAETDQLLAKASEAEHKTLQQQRQSAQQALKNAEAEQKKQEEELQKARDKQKKDDQAVQLAQKTILATEAAIGRAEKSVERTEAVLAEAQQTANSFAKDVKQSEVDLTRAKKEANSLRSQLTSATFSADDWRLFVQDHQGRLFAFASQSGELVEAFKTTLRGKVVSANNGRLTIVDGQTVTCWGIDRSWELVKVLGDAADDSTFMDRVTSLAFSDDGQWLATGGGEPSRSGEVQLWRVADWTRQSGRLPRCTVTSCLI